MDPKQHVYADLVAAGHEVDRMVADLDDHDWDTPTPAEDWSVRHQIAHLAAVFQLAALAAGEPASFVALAYRLGPDFNANVRTALAPYLADPPPPLLRRWRAQRAAAEQALAAVPDDRPVPWLVRPLPAPVLAAAGMMELFGHGQDIADGLGLDREHGDRLRHLVEFAVRTWDFGYQARGLAVPDVSFRFEITAPSGATWAFGPVDAEQRITGPAVDFCLLVTRRRHHADLAVRATGADAQQWLEIAQAYRGPAGSGRVPGQFAPAARVAG